MCNIAHLHDRNDVACGISGLWYFSAICPKTGIAAPVRW